MHYQIYVTGHFVNLNYCTSLWFSESWKTHFLSVSSGPNDACNSKLMISHCVNQKWFNPPQCYIYPQLWVRFISLWKVSYAKICILCGLKWFSTSKVSVTLLTNPFCQCIVLMQQFSIILTWWIIFKVTITQSTPPVLGHIGPPLDISDVRVHDLPNRFLFCTHDNINWVVTFGVVVALHVTVASLKTASMQNCSRNVQCDI